MSGEDALRPGDGVKLTYDDFVLFPDDGQRHELIDGDHYVTPSPNLRHQRILSDLFGAIWSYLQQHPYGEVFLSPLDVILSRFDVVEPDLLYVSAGRRAEVLGAQWVEGAPDLVVEIGSKSTRRRDETIKRDLYERFGVQEYWTVDPDTDAVTVYRRIEGRYEQTAHLTAAAGDAVTTPLLPGLEIPLARVFRD